MRKHHAIDYIEFTVRDIAADKQFYTSAFGWGWTTVLSTPASRVLKGKWVGFAKLRKSERAVRW